MTARIAILLSLACAACSTNEPGDTPGDSAVAGDPSAGDPTPGDPTPGDPAPGDPAPGDPMPPLSLTVVTFNTGTSTALLHDLDPFDGYTSDEADIADEWYGNGLAWQDAIDGATTWFAALKPDLVVFQEIFHPEECSNIPSEHWDGFICETWQAGDPTVAQMVLGDDYQIACNWQKPDKCAAVKKTFGSFAGCDQDLCLDGLDGYPIDGCGSSGARNGRGLVELTRGDTLTLVNHHGSSGLEPADQQCRVKQIDQIFIDFGDGEPGANGTRNIVMGDLNTDPGRWEDVDPSAARWEELVGDSNTWDWITDVGGNATPTYNGVANIDHVASDTFEGSCVHPGVDGEPPVLDFILFDHKPAVCTITEHN